MSSAFFASAIASACLPAFDISAALVSSRCGTPVVMLSRRRSSLNGSAESSTRMSTMRSTVESDPGGIGFTTRMPADCIPRVSPPFDWPASSASINRSAIDPLPLR